MTEANPYPTPGGVEAAIKDAAKKASAADPSLTTGERIRMAHFDRFLSRVFSEGDQSEWLLKGGTGMLARVPSTRATGDIDLYRNGFTLDQAVADLRRLASIDLGDHFTFAYVGAKTITAVDSQPYTEGYHVSFDVQIGLKRMGTLGIDLVVGPGVTSEVTTVEPANRLSLPRLISNPYRLFPIADQIADKVCATMTIFGAELPPARRISSTWWSSPSRKTSMELLSAMRSPPRDADGRCSRSATSPSPRPGVPPTQSSPSPFPTAQTSPPSRWPQNSSRASSTQRSTAPPTAGRGRTSTSLGADGNIGCRRRGQPGRPAPLILSMALAAWRRIERTASAWSSATISATDGVVSPPLPRRRGAPRRCAA